MVIHLDQIRDEGYLVDQPVSREQLDAMLQADGHDTGFRALGPAPLDVVLRKLNDGAVLVKGTMEAPVRAPCKRCLADVDLTLPVAFTLNLVPKAKAAPPTLEDEAAADRRDRREEGESAGSFAIDEVDQDYFEGKKIDLDPLLQEQLLLALPMNAVCREDCKGLCGQCGQNLNDAQCGCDVRPVDPRLAPLKNIKLN